jgi:hypothetical protein
MRIITGLPRSVADLLADVQDLTTLRGIGDLAGKIEEIARTGCLSLREVRP